MEDYPHSLQQLETIFISDETCLEYMSKIRWPEEFICPICGPNELWHTGRGLWHCKNSNRQTSVTAGTIFHGTRKPLHLLFRETWDVIAQKNGASALGINHILGLNSYQTASA